MLLHTRPRARFSTLALTVHWIIAFSMVLSVGIQHYAVYYASEAPKAELYMLHRSLGLVAFVFSILFLVLKIVDRRPHITAIPESFMWLYMLVRYSLFLLPILLFVSGWLIFDLKDKDFYFFGHWIHAPDLFPKDLLASAEARLHHKLLSAYAMLIIFVHGGAAMFHHFIMKDKILCRMAPILFAHKDKKDHEH